MLATKSIASRIAGQSTSPATAWFTFSMGFVANFDPNGFKRALVALADSDHAAVADARSHPTHSGTGDAPYERR
jgi:hypothetical protein